MKRDMILKNSKSRKIGKKLKLNKKGMPKTEYKKTKNVTIRVTAIIR